MSDPQGPVWSAIIDCAQDPRLLDLVQGCANRICLFKGKDLPHDLLATAPWLVRIDPSEKLLSTWQQHGRGKNWGIMVLSQLSLKQMQRHFRKFLQAKLPDGTIALFRFYDPRVFPTYMLAATPEERAPWFAGIDQYTVEETEGAPAHHFRMIDGAVYDGDKRLI